MSRLAAAMARSTWRTGFPGFPFPFGLADQVALGRHGDDVGQADLAPISRSTWRLRSVQLPLE